MPTFNIIGHYKCETCGKEYEKLQSYLGHRSSHIKKNYKNTFNIIKKSKCRFCNKEFDKPCKLGAHVVLCKLNPKRKLTIKKIVESHLGNKNSSKRPEVREKISFSRSKTIEEKGNGGFLDVKWFKIKNILNEEFIVRGTWELKVANWLNENNILWKRKIYLKYERKDHIKRTYTPDFYLPKKNIYLEVKGYFSQLDKEKIKLVIEQSKIDLRLIFKKDLDNLQEILK